MQNFTVPSHLISGTVIGNDQMSVAWRPGGKKLITGSSDKTAKMWDTESGKELLTLRHDGFVNKDWKMKAEVLTYSRSRGLFAGIDLNGAALTQDKDETRILYGKFVRLTRSLKAKSGPIPRVGLS